MNEKNIQSILTETRVFNVPEHFQKNCILNAEKRRELDQAAAEDYEGFWADLARQHLDWQRDFSNSLDSSNAPHYQWFNDGEINVSYNCLDRHIATKGDKTAIIFEGEKGDIRKLTYKTLLAEVSQFANALKAQGVCKGDRVVIYMPMIVEGVIAMQACARIGAIHSVVFGGFSAEALRDRINDAGAKVVITADGGTSGR